MLPAVALMALLALVGAACVGGDTDEATDDPGGDAVADGLDIDEDLQTIVIGTSQDVTGLDATKESINTNFMLPNVQETLVRRTREGDTEPHLATSFEEAEDQMSWTIELRDDVYFHNGEQMTAEDVAFTFETMADDSFQEWNLWNYWNMVNEAEVVDDYTVRIHLDEPNALVEHDGTRLFVLPKEHYEEVGHEEFSQAPVGTGPFKLMEYRPDDRLVMEAFDDYFLGRPAVDQLIWRPIPDDAARVAALQAGEVDIVVALGVEQIPTLQDDPETEVLTADSLERFRVVVDTGQEPFDQVEVRKAINHAIDKESIVEAILDGRATVIPAALTPIEPGFNPELEPYEYDPGLAREYLAEAGFPDGLEEETGFACRDGYIKAEEVCTAIAQMLGDVGIPVQMQMMEQGDYTTASSEKTLPPLSFNGHGGGGSFFGGHHYRSVISCPDGPTPLSGSPNWGGYYCNEEIDELIWEAHQIWASDRERAEESIGQAEVLFHEDAGYGFLYNTQNVYGSRAGLHWEPHPDVTMILHEAYWE